MEDFASGEKNEKLIHGLKEQRADVIIHLFPEKTICRAAEKAGIPVRIATGRRYYTWLTCTRLLYYSRRRSGLHESQLNLKMLKPLGLRSDFRLDEIKDLYGLSLRKNIQPVNEFLESRLLIKPGRSVTDHIKPGRYNVILHPKSKGSAREWGLENFSGLISLLPEEKFNILVTGTASEGEQIRSWLDKHSKRIADLTGKLTLGELIGLISCCDGMVAASTGPLHIASALGIRAIGLFAPMSPIFPQRWAPLGEKATFLVLDKKCNDCRKTMDCRCIREITPSEVASKFNL
jgi:ADP-heptose:LPS heptosyltransferase